MNETSETAENKFAPRKKISRIGMASRIDSALRLHKPTVEGLENLINIPKNENLVISTTHLSDIDMEVAVTTVASYRDVSVTSQSINLKNPIVGRIMRWVGKNEVYGISGKLGKKGTRSLIYRFNPQDYEAMKVPVEKGRAMIIAAHKPAYEWKLPDKPGLGAIYLAQISRATILPAAVDVQYPKFIDLHPNNVTGTLKRLLQRKRLDVKVTFGKPIRLDPIPLEELEIVAKFLNHDERHKMAKDEIEKAKVTLEKLRLQGSEVMRSLANMLPQNKKGSW